MLQFDPMYQPYASNRFCVTARNGMVATGSNLAGAAGLEMLKKGGRCRGGHGGSSYCSGAHLQRSGI